MKRLLIFVISVIFFFLFSLLILEVSLRIVDRYAHKFYNPGIVNSGTFVLNPELIYTAKPSNYLEYKTSEFTESVQTNQYGWRDKPIADKGSETIRIIAVGDSFTFGHGIENNEKTYPKRLENYLNQLRPSSKKFEVFNAGQKGYSPDQEYRLITTQLLAHKPDYIIWNFSDPGDLYNLTESGNWPIPALYDIRDDKLVSLDARLNWLYVSSFFLRHVPDFIGRSYIINFLISQSSQINFLSRKPRLSHLELKEWGFKKMVLEVKEVQKLTQANDFKLIVVILPYKEVFMDSDSEYIQAFEAFGEQIKNEGIKIINIRNELKENTSFYANDNGKNNGKILGVQSVEINNLYFKSDYHPNEKGADLFGYIVAKLLL